MKSFAHKKYKNETELSKYTWSLKAKNEKYELTWKTLIKSNTFRRKSGTCNLCLEEKLAILNNRKIDANNSLNKRTELLNKCRHNNNRKAFKRKRKKDPPN